MSSETWRLSPLPDSQDYVDLFDIEIVEKVDPHRDYWVVGETKENGHLPIKGTTGVAAANGLYMWGFIRRAILGT